MCFAQPNSKMGSLGLRWQYERRIHSDETRKISTYMRNCGTGGMLSVAEEYLHNLNASTELVSFGQEINDQTFFYLQNQLNSYISLYITKKRASSVVLR